MNELLTINNVRAFIDENGIAQLNLEDIARGLGFTDNTKGTEYVKWDRVKQYLNDLKFSTEVSKDSFIPENIFYRLAMKAKNETAEKFQAIVADEILPAIRKTGTYSAPQMSQLQIVAAIAQAAADQEKQIKQLTTDLQGMRDVISLDVTSWRTDSKNLLVKMAQKAGDIGLVSDFWKQAYKLLDTRMGVNVKQRLTNLRNRLMNEGVCKSKRDKANQLDVIGEDKKLIEGFVAIVKEMSIKAGIA